MSEINHQVEKNYLDRAVKLRRAGSYPEDLRHSLVETMADMDEKRKNNWDHYLRDIYRIHVINKLYIKSMTGVFRCEVNTKGHLLTRRTDENIFLEDRTGSCLDDQHSGCWR